MAPRVVHYWPNYLCNITSLAGPEAEVPIRSLCRCGIRQVLIPSDVMLPLQGKSKHKWRQQYVPQRDTRLQQCKRSWKTTQIGMSFANVLHVCTVMVPGPGTHSLDGAHEILAEASDQDAQDQGLKSETVKFRCVVLVLVQNCVASYFPRVLGMLLLRSSPRPRTIKNTTSKHRSLSIEALHRNAKGMTRIAFPTVAPLPANRKTHKVPKVLCATTCPTLQYRRGK